MINAARLNKRISLQKIKEGSVDEEGYAIPGETTSITLWAQVKKVSMREYFEAKATQSENIVCFIIRYRKGIDEDMTILYDGSQYNITSIINEDESNIMLTIIGRLIQ